MQKLYYGGDIITMCSEGDCPEAVLITDGRISHAGSLLEAEKLASQDTVKVDLKGKTLMPAFIDGHGHVSMAGQMSMMADLGECTSFSEIIDTLKQYRKEHHLTDKDMLVGWGYDHNFLAEGRHPDKEVLDQVSETIPIYIGHVSSHMGCANSAALLLAGITGETPDPKGGVIGRMAGCKEPNGYLEEAGMTLMQAVLQTHMKLDATEGLRRAQELYLRYGVTTVQDGASNAQSIAMMKQACDSGQFQLDVVSYPVMGQENPARFFAEYPECAGKYQNHFKLGGYKAVLDGSPQGKSAWLTKPYENSGDYCAYSWYPDETVEGFMRQALRDGKQILVHCNGDAAADQYLNAYQKALEEVPEAAKADLRPVMIHCQTVRNDQLDRMAELSMIPSIFVGHVYYWGDIHRKNLGEERGRRISPCKSALDRGLVVNLHQDTPVTKPDMMHSVWAAVNRITRFGEVLGKEQRIDVYEALKAVTINAAYAYHEETEKGTIEKGKLADLVILDSNPLKVDKLKIKDIVVEETIKEGTTLYKRK